MPELPEVETVRQGLHKLLPGQVIREVTFDWDQSFPNEPASVAQFLVGAQIVSINRRAKALLINLNTNYSLVVHLKMTGQLVFRGDNGQKFGAGHPSESLVGQLPDKSTRVILTLDHGTLFFNDQRKFGWMRLVPTPEVPDIPFMRKLGPEPLDPKFTYDVFKNRLYTRPKSAVKAVLLDQTIIAGIGNIYSDESLFAAKIHPATPVKNITEAKLQALYRELLAVLQLSIQKGGSSDRNYVNAEGKKGSYLTFAKVYKRKGLPCPRCGTPIERIVVAGRGTHICPHCQVLPRVTK
ncbi:MAG TPA: bifunctional DNA-formamidopyrimidine glycosylase/DNA-(apurinic or apyrimidinic site) lyase [Candidatus Saccharimonadales bacterium]|nr:bifunctional DNA-formamidopyrimidine glycosylase/DNA-(apurinic or apyrimidinic site) lyase [Candidatus Saccharimonadales bacterium]